MLNSLLITTLHTIVCSIKKVGLTADGINIMSSDKVRHVTHNRF